MTEPGVALTDYGLTILCFILGGLIYQNGERGRFRTWFTAFFISLTFASAFGGTVHGFFLDPKTIGYKVLWPLTLISIGVAAFSIGCIAARMLFEEKSAQAICKIMLGVLVVYGIIVLTFTQDYLIAIIDYLPPTVVLLGALLRRYLKDHETGILYGIIGIFLTFIAAGIQQAGIGFDPVYFDHNAFYHLVQAMGLFMVFLCARHLTAVQAPSVAKTSQDRRSKYML